MIFVSAGHNSKSKKVKADPGAVANGYKEGDLAIEFRNLVCRELDALRAPYITDTDEETLAMYLQRIKTGNGSVVVEFHFDAAGSAAATGTTGLIEAEADRLDKAFAKELTDSTAAILGIRNRGILDEGQSHRGRLGLMREDGIICLLEICFITNKNDLDRYFANKELLAKRYAEIIVKYENIIP